MFANEAVKRIMHLCGLEGSGLLAEIIRDAYSRGLEAAIEEIANDSNIHRLDANRLTGKIRALKTKE